MQQLDGLKIASDTPPDFGIITNDEFILNVSRNIPENAFLAVCSKPGNPEIGGWKAERVKKGSAQLAEKNNNYLNCSSFYPAEDNSFCVLKERFAACHFLMLDDIGTKISLEKFNQFKFSWLIETSPGNYQGGIIFDIPVDRLQAESLHKAIIDAGLCDPGASGPANRWARLPLGINGKAKHRINSENAFECKLVEWHPERHYSPEEIIKFFDLIPPSPVQHITPSKSDKDILTNESLNPNSENLQKIPELLEHIDPDCSYHDWLNVLMAVFHESNGSVEGFQLIDFWSRKGKKYRGSSELREKWKSFKLDVNNPITIATIYRMVKTKVDDRQAISDTVNFPFVDEIHASTSNAKNITNPLKMFSLLGKADEIEKNVLSERQILGQIALQGQLTVIYSAPNTGKTLIILSLLMESIVQKRVNPSKVYYLNVDDNSAGLVAKLRIADEYKFNVLAEGYEDFNANHFLKYVIEMTETDQASGVIIILDTLKKFVNLMDKTQSSNFSKIIRKFALKGGTLIALAHTNKNPGRDGKQVYGGTSDIIDDFDCAYTIATVQPQADSGVKVVEFDNIKRRGNVTQRVAFGYCNKSDISYSELLASVQPIDDSQLIPLKQASDQLSNREKINTVIACIKEGINSKMKLAHAVSSRTGISRAIAIQLIEKYTGTDPTIHKWSFSVRERGAKVFTILENPMQNPCDDNSLDEY